MDQTKGLDGQKSIKKIIISSKRSSEKLETSPIPKIDVSKKTKILFKKISKIKKQHDKLSESLENIAVVDILKKIRNLLNDLDKEFVKLWDENGPIVLFDLKVNSQNETILHYVCQNLDVELAYYLINYTNFSELINSHEKSIEKGVDLDMFQFRDFIFDRSKNGENALYQCLMNLNRNKTKNYNENNEKLKCILENFIDTDLFLNPNDYIHKRVGHKTTFLHLLIEREQLELLDYFIETFTFGYDFFKPLDFTVKDYLGKTPIMTAMETGNQNIIKLIYNKVKYHLNEEEIEKIKDYIDAQNTSENNFLTSFLENKLIITSRNDVKEIVKSMKNEFTIELDGRSFDYLWLDYLTLVKELNIPLSQRDVERLSYDIHKQILINRINKKLSKMFTLVTLIVNNQFEHFEQLNNFVKFLPYNFKIVFVSPKVALDKFQFYIKHITVDYEPNSPTRITEIQHSNLESFCKLNVVTINEYKNIDDFKQAKMLFKQNLDFYKSGQNFTQKSRDLFEKLADCFANLAHNPSESFTFYQKAVDAYEKENNLSNNENYIKLYFKMFNNLLKVETDSNKREKAFNCLSNICKGSSDEVMIKLYDSSAKYFDKVQLYKEEIEVLKKALSIYNENPEIEKSTRIRNMAVINNHIYCAYSKLHDEYETGLELKYLEEANKFYLDSSLEEKAMANYNFGLAYSEDKDRQKEAISYFQQSIEQYKKFYNDEETIDIANAISNLSLAYEELEQYEEAQSNYKKALELYEAIYKIDHQDIAMALNNFGTCYPTSQDVDKNYLFSKRLIENVIEAHEMYKKLSNDQNDLSNDIAETADNLGHMYLEINMKKNAEHYLNIALKLYHQNENNEDKIEILFNLHKCDKQNEQYQKDIIETSEQLYGEEYIKIMNLTEGFFKFLSEKKPSSINYKTLLFESMIQVSVMNYFREKSNTTSTEKNVSKSNDFNMKTRIIQNNVNRRITWNPQKSVEFIKNCNIHNITFDKKRKRNEIETHLKPLVCV